MASYATVEEADAYHARFLTPEWDLATVVDKEIALEEGTRDIDARYAHRWKGARVLSTQSNDWPRTGVLDRDGVEVDSTTLPPQLIDATAVMANEFIRLGTTEVLMPSEVGGTIKRKLERVEGAVTEETEYTGGSTAQRVFPLVDRILADLIQSPGLVRFA